MATGLALVKSNYHESYKKDLLRCESNILCLKFQALALIGQTYSEIPRSVKFSEFIFENKSN